jgi:hypothetical protein
MTSIENLEVREARHRPRFQLSNAVEALVANNRATITSLSAGGMGITHASPLKIGSDVQIRISAPENDSSVVIRGRISWSRLSRCADRDGKYPYNSGISITDDSPAVAGLMGRLIRSYGTRQPASLEAKRQALEEKARSREHPIVLASSTRRTVAPRITPDQALMIQQARGILANNPDAAIKWYDRAKYSLVSRGIIASTERSTPYRREVLVVWEYLGGTLDLDLVSSILDLKTSDAP